MSTKNLLYIWKKRNQILEGIRHSVFKQDDVEDIAQQRLATCRSNQCKQYDPYGTSEAAFVKGAESCGSCGCKLTWKTRALSDACPLRLWEAILSPEEEVVLKQKLGLTDEA